MSIAALSADSNVDLLRLVTCGSVDDGKSTLIGRLLLDADGVPDDRLTALTRDSRHFSPSRRMPDPSLLLDGLQAERQQGITIDVGYKFFSTTRRRFIVADAPGHEQYTRNMATAASMSDVAVVLVDATKGLLKQTYRHSTIVSLMGVNRVILAVNKMDLVDYDKQRFMQIADAFRPMAGRLGLSDLVTIPVSALLGDNVIKPSSAMAWYDGQTLLHHLETVRVEPQHSQPFRMPVQWVNRDGSGFRGYAGTVTGGAVRQGDDVVILPSGTRTRVDRIITFDGDLNGAEAGHAVTLTFTENVDVVRGDIVAAADRPSHVSDQFTAYLVWMDRQPMLPGRRYLIRLGTAMTTATVRQLDHQLHVDTGARTMARQLAINEIGHADVVLDRALPFDRYEENRETGGFILIDRMSNATVGAGMIRSPLHRAADLTWQKFTVDKAARTAVKQHRPAVLWFTGLSGSGKSTIADAVERRLLALGKHAYTLDGDNVRHGLNRDLGFADADRIENIRRVTEVAHLFADAGLIVLVSFISPFLAERQAARERLAADEFIEIFVDTPLDECERRDPKGLYRKARRGDLAAFTGIDSAYEPPPSADIHIRTMETPLDVEVDLILETLRRRGVID